MKIALTSENVKLLGRTVLFEDMLLLSLSGSGIEFEYTGKGLTLTFIGGEASEIPNNQGNQARIGIYVNGQLKEDFLLNERKIEKRITAVSGEGTSVIRVIKLSECAMSLVGILPIEITEGEKVNPTPEKKLKIEFIGDSIPVDL